MYNKIYECFSTFEAAEVSSQPIISPYVKSNSKSLQESSDCYAPVTHHTS